MLHDNKIILKTSKDKEGKFGRILGELWIENDRISINEHLINNHHAVRYVGQSKDDIKIEHRLNRIKIAELKIMFHVEQWHEKIFRTKANQKL